MIYGNVPISDVYNLDEFFLYCLMRQKVLNFTVTLVNPIKDAVDENGE